MSNVVRFPQSGEPRPGSQAASASDDAQRHAVQFYDDDGFLLDTVSDYLAQGLRSGERVLAIVGERHASGLLERLEQRGHAGARESGQLSFVDARGMLSEFMIGTTPDADLFSESLTRLFLQLRAGGHEQARIRAYGEMVDLLWAGGNSSAALRLEELWNDAGKQHELGLLCAYSMGNFYKQGDAQRFMEVCRQHSHVTPAESFTELDDANARLREISLLQQRALALEAELAQRKELESALREALRERRQIEEELRASVVREREARTRAEESDAFKEVFLAILGHDLRNPLNTVLTTARLMQLRHELPAESHKRLDRVVASGERMQRMIDQLLDVARARLADGIAVTRGAPQDLRSLLDKIVEELRVVHPDCRIDSRDSGPVVGSVDADRFEQVISNLLGNALAHGDRARPITISVEQSGDHVRVSVHNFGRPIEPAFMPLLFDLFKRPKTSRTSTQGLGLGLYISERIVRAHGGHIDVESSEQGGTRFEAIFPRLA
jgi:signal transduction histidine kinase